MPNNENKITEALTESQAKEIIRLLSERSAEKAINDAERAEIEANSRKNAEKEAELAERERALAAHTDTALSDKQALADAMQKLAADRQMVTDALADVARREAAAEALLPQIAALLESNRQANAREAKRDAVIDTWGQSITRIEQNVSLLVSMPELIADVTGAIKAGFELAAKDRAADRVLADQIAIAVESVGSRQEEIYESTTRRFNELDVQVNAVHTSVDRIGIMVNRLFDFVTNIRDMIEANNERLIKIEVEVFSLKKHVTSVANHFHKQVMTELDKFTQIPGKIETQIKNLTSTIAKIKGETDSVVTKYTTMMDSMGLRAEAFEQQVQGIKELAVVLRENLRRGVEIEMGRLQGTMTDFATEAVKAYNEILKKSEMHDVLREIHLILEHVSLANQETSQVVSTVSDLVGDVDGAIKRTSVDLMENLSISSKAIQAQVHGIEETAHRANSLTSDSLARIESMNTGYERIEKKTSSILFSMDAIAGQSSESMMYVAEKLTSVFTSMCVDLRAELPKLVATEVSERMVDLDIASVAKLLGGENPEEQ